VQDVRNFQRVAVGGTVAMIVLSIVLTVCFTKFVDVDMSTSEAVVTGIALSFSSTAVALSHTKTDRTSMMAVHGKIAFGT
jgi:predicted Kef-type K+ transport protein